MKTLLALFALILSPFLDAVFAASPEEIAGVRWEFSPAQVRKTLSTRPGVAFSAETPEQIAFTGGTFAGKNVQAWRFDFRNGKMTKATVSFKLSDLKDEKGWINDQVFNDLHRQLDQKYGKGKFLRNVARVEVNWSFPIRPGASRTIQLYYYWDEKRFDLTYSDIPAPSSTPSPATTATPSKDL